MVANELDYVVGVDTHRDEHTLALVEATTGALLAQQTVAASAGGYTQALRFASQQAEGVRLWAVEGAGHYGAGLAPFQAPKGLHHGALGAHGTGRQTAARRGALAEAPVLTSRWRKG